MSLDAYEPYLSLVVALAVGLLIGLERERQSTDDAAGVRTFPLFALMGALTTLLAPVAGWWLVATGLLGTIVYGALVYRRTEDVGITTETAIPITYLLGAVAASQGVFAQTEEKLVMVAMVAVVVTALLTAKPMLHEMASKVSQEDSIATVKFLIVAVVVLPLLPDRTFGPLGVLNPRDIGWMVVLIAGISFVGYVAARFYGSRGLGLTGLIGGLVSSTAVMASFAPRAKERDELVAPVTMAVVGASSIMFPRVLVEVGAVNPALLPIVAIPFGVMSVVGAVLTFVLYRRARDRDADAPSVPLKNPFELGSALWFGAIFAIVLLASKAATEYLGTGGTYVAGLLAGTTDVDAITLSMANLAKEGTVDPPVAATTILLGALSNTLVKGGLAVGLGGWKLGRRVLAAFALILAAGAASLGVVWTLG